MRLEERSAVTIDRCDTCQHIWFDGFELDRVLKAERKLREYFALYQIPFRTATSQSAMRCPRCDKYSLTRGWVGGVLAHRCHICRGFYIEGSAIAKVGMTGTSAFGRFAYREVQLTNVVVDSVTTPESFGEMILEFLRNLLAES
jgi:Zn-finger nucleic acid-binding protein